MEISFKKILFGKTTNLFIQFFRYTLVGGLAFVVDLVLLFVLTEYAHWHYLVSATLSFLAGLLVNYILSTQWIFRSSKIKNKKIEKLFKFYSKIILWQRYASWLRACQPCIRNQWSAS